MLFRSNRKDIATLKQTEQNHYNDLDERVNAITLDNMLKALGLKVNAAGALCYVTTA